MTHLPLLAFGFGPTEILIVAAVSLLLFGNRLPEAMRGLGRGYKEFRDGVQEAGVQEIEQDQGAK